MGAKVDLSDTDSATPPSWFQSIQVRSGSCSESLLVFFPESSQSCDIGHAHPCGRLAPPCCVLLAACVSAVTADTAAPY